MPEPPAGAAGSGRRRRPPTAGFIDGVETPAPAPAPPRPPRRRPRAPAPIEPEPTWQELQHVGPSGLDGVPASYDDGTSWLRSGARRHGTASVLAVLAGWTGVWLSLWGALLGAILGLLVAIGVDTSPAVSSTLFHLGIGQAVTALSIITGIVLGAAGGFIAVLHAIFVTDYVQLEISFIAGVVVKGLGVITIAAFEQLGLRLRGYRRLSRDEVRRIAPLVKAVADAMELPALPRFAIADIVVPNAWAHMRTVVLTTGLLDALPDDELMGVLAHELHHWRQGDSVGLRVVWVAALPLALVYDVGIWLAGGRPEVPPPESIGIPLPRGLLALMGWIIAWPAWVMTRLVLVPVVSASQRRYEYEADAAAAAVGLGAPLSSALRTVGRFETGRTGWEQAMTATHPPIELRIEALQEPRPDDEEYQEEELHGPTSAELRRLITFWKRSPKP